MNTRSAKREASTGRPPRVTLKDVAKAAGVSMMTVSNVLHDRPNVSAALRELVQRRIEELGYVPNRAAQQLAGVTRPHFGLLYASVINPFIASVIVGSLTAASRLGIDVTIELAELDDPKSLRSTISRMRDTGVDGLLLPSPIAEFVERTFRKKPLKFPAVAIAPGFSMPGMASVRVDEEGAAFELVSSLLDLGHTRIGHLAGPETQSGSFARHEGYRAALLARGIEPCAEHLERSRFNFQDGVEAAERLLAREPRVTAVFAANDTLAASVLAVTHRRGIAVPRSLSVVGYDDSPVAEQVWPALTTVHQDAFAATERAVEMLNASVAAWRAGSFTGPAEDLLLPYRIVHRASTAPAPAD
ncbi:LacI family DNA-binding transcriptional regulator [Amaricoccus sp. W119]|uniref:LacI family DNA-binding transcriptional regulator n=1 Tax=Amaricoccus sp. W119 TaxID=3391833 RepID=UPI0039A5CD2B